MCRFFIKFRVKLEIFILIIVKLRYCGLWVDVNIIINFLFNWRMKSVYIIGIWMNFVVYSWKNCKCL